MTRRVLVVADHADLGARAAARAASSSLGDPVRVVVVSGDELAAARWRHHVSAYGVASTSLRLPGLGELTDDDLAGVLVRPCGELVPPGFRRSSERDRGYAAAELSALASSWLLSLGARVVNAAEGASPWGPTWVPRRWLARAAAAGFDVSPGAPDRRLLVAGRHVTGAADDTEVARARRLSQDTGCGLLELSLAGECVTAITCVPALLEPEHVNALAAALVDLAGAHREVAA